MKGRKRRGESPQKPGGGPPKARGRPEAGKGRQDAGGAGHAGLSAAGGAPGRIDTPEEVLPRKTPRRDLGRPIP
jgi:hypothetical protein